MSDNASGYSTREAAEVRDRIADILGYCNLDGRLHDPENFDKKLLRSKWVCPDCSTEAGKVAYKRAKELRWMLILPEGRRTDEENSLGREDDAEDQQEDEDEDEAAADGEGDDEEDDVTEGTDSEDVKARIESAQEDIEQLEETAEQ